MECLDLHLREITINDYRGSKQDVNIARLFIQNARVLELMRIGVKNCHHDVWWNTQCKRLEMNNRASADAHFQFGYLPQFDRFGPGGVDRAKMHDLSVADPFFRVVQPR